MGLTPMGGVVMGTRPGDIDPGLVIYLIRQPGASVDSVEEMLNRHSGIKVLGGVNDMRELRKCVAAGDTQAQLAITIFCRSVIKAFAGFLALYGADAIVFTGGIGQHDAESRGAIGGGLSRMGVGIDAEKNKAAGHGLGKISGDGSVIEVYVAPAEEDLMIAQHVVSMCRVSPQAAGSSS
jgi:acetate kinase